MKKFILFLLLIIGLTTFAQQKGISYQAVIINPSEIKAPGYNGTAIPLANKSVCMSFQIVNTTGQVEYQESHSVTTDSYGMVNLVIGTGTSGTGLVSTLEAVSWNQGTKKLVVGYNSTGVCSNYTEVSNQLLNYSPYSLYAHNADIKDGYVTDVKVAMGINPAKVGLGNVNNTSDASKPVSIATQTALNLKANTTDVTASLALKENQSNKSLDIVTDATSTVKYPSVKAVKDYVDSNASSLTIGDADAINKGKIQLAGDLSGTAAVPTVPGLVLKANTADVTTALSTKVDKESGKGLSTNDYTSLEKTKLAAIIGTNTGDQDLSTFAVATDVTTSLALKENQSNKSLDIVTDATSTVKYPSVKAVKDYVDSNASSLTIGAISSTSTSTGANITSGVLSLTPADASNGGIVITGVQTFGGAKTFLSDLMVNGITVGKGNSEIYSDPNETEPIPNTTNTAIGFQVLKDNFDGIRNTGVGYKTLSVNDEGSSNTAIGFESLSVNLEGNNNTGIGSRALANNIGDRNTAIGGDALFYNVSGDYNTSIGSGSGPSGTNRAILNNTTAVGYNALVTENNTIQLGNTAVTNVKTSGTLTAGTVTYPNAHNSTAGQVLTTDASGVASWTTPASGGNALTMGSISDTSTANGASITAGILNLAPASSSTGGIVTTGAQIFEGTKTFSADLSVNALTVGRGGGNLQNNTAIGRNALNQNTSGIYNTAIGVESIGRNLTGISNTAIGYYALHENTTAGNNTAIGMNALRSNISGENNTAIGSMAGFYTAIFDPNTGPMNSTYLGQETRASAAGRDNEIVIGAYAIGRGDNTIQLGSTGISKVYTSGTLTAGTVTYPNVHNATAGQVLTTDVEGMASWTTPASSSSPTYTLGLQPDLGGYVFYLAPGGKHGLVAETQNQSTASDWYNAQDNISKSVNHSTDGQKFTDWRVPTRNELSLMYGARDAIGNFTNNSRYWSSTQIESNAYYRTFTTGGVGEVDSNVGSFSNLFFVRAVRSF